MEFAGQRLRRARERLNLKFRDVELASQQIAERHGNQEFVKDPRNIQGPLFYLFSSALGIGQARELEAGQNVGAIK